MLVPAPDRPALTTILDAAGREALAAHTDAVKSVSFRLDCHCSNQRATYTYVQHLSQVSVLCLVYHL